MVKLSMSFSTALLCISLAPAAHAYADDPAPETLASVHQSPIAQPVQAFTKESCVHEVTPSLVALLALPDDWNAREADTTARIACAQ